MVSFARTLQKHATKTGTYYVLSIPREIAKDLVLKIWQSIGVLDYT